MNPPNTLLKSIYAGDIKTVEEIVNRQFDVISLVWAIQAKQKDIVRLLVDRGLRSSDSKTMFLGCYYGRGWTPLMFAAATGDTSIVKMVSEAGPHAKNIANDNGETALMMAARKNAGDLVADLVTAANVVMVNRDGQSAMDIAMFCQSETVVEKLREFEIMPRKKRSRQ